MKLKITKRKESPIEKPYIYEDEKFHKIRRALIVVGLPLLIIYLFYHFYINPHLPLKSVLFGSATGLSAFFVVVSMIKEGSKVFWCVFAGLLLLGLFLTYNSSIQSNFENNFIAIAIWNLPIFYVFTMIYRHWKDHHRDVVKDRESLDKIQSQKMTLKKKKTSKVKSNDISKKKEPIRKRFSVAKDKIFNKTLQYHEPEIYSEIRAKIMLYGLPSLVILLIIGGFTGKVNDYPAYAAAGGIGVGGFICLVSMFRPNSMRFWIIFFICLIVGTPLLMFPPEFVSSNPLATIAGIGTFFMVCSAGLLFKTKFAQKERPPQSDGLET